MQTSLCGYNALSKEDQTVTAHIHQSTEQIQIQN